MSFSFRVSFVTTCSVYESVCPPCLCLALQVSISTVFSFEFAFFHAVTRATNASEFRPQKALGSPWPQNTRVSRPATFAGLTLTF